MPYNYKTEVQRYRRYYQSLEPILSKPKSRAYTTIVFSFLAISLFGWYAIRPTIQTILVLKRETRDKIEINKKMEDKIAALIEAQANYQEVETLLPIVDQALPTIPDAIPLMIQIRNLASESGVIVSTLQVPSVPLTDGELVPGTGKTPVKQQIYDVSVVVSGSYQNIHAFLDGITSMRRIISVNSVTITPATAELIGSGSAIPSSRLLQLALKLKAYYLLN